MNLQIGEILDLVHRAKTKKDKIKVLQENQEPYLLQFLSIALNENITWAYTKDTLPEYTPDEAPYGYARATLILEIRRFYLWDRNFALPSAKLKSITIETLEALHPREAEIFAAMISNQKLPVKGLTRKLVNEVFPNLVPPLKENNKE